MTQEDDDGVVMTTIFTIGHSNHEAAALVALLRGEEIDVVVDVRSSPYSRYVPQANRESLARTLAEAGIAYLWRGDALGGKPEGVVGDYDKIRGSVAFQQGITELIARASKQRLAILCSEGDYRHCHRHLLLEPALREQGARVLHIEPDGSLVDESEKPRQLTLF